MKLLKAVKDYKELKKELPPPRRIDTGRHKIDVHVFPPKNADHKAPGILYLHELFGIQRGYVEDAQELADAGYLVYLPNLYTNGPLSYCIRAAVLEFRNPSTGTLNQEINALLDVLSKDQLCNGALGMVGMCITGGFVLHMAQRKDMQAPVMYHHYLGLFGAGVPKKEEGSLSQIQHIQGHWCKFDLISPERKRKKLKELLSSRLDCQVHPKVKHGIRSQSRDLPEAQKAWDSTKAFFDRHLKSHDASNPEP